jgi:hypothetical protein
MIHTKSNIARHGPAQGYSINSGRFMWTGETDATYGDLYPAITKQ